MTLKKFGYWSKQVTLAVCGGTLIACGFIAVFVVTFHYVAPAKTTTSKIVLLHPVVDDFWIRIPADIDRNKECPASGTMTLRRENDYGPPLGKRTDTVVIGLTNTTLSGIGHSSLMLWFERPQHLDPGSWSFDAKVSDDCGGVGDIFNYSLANPRSVIVPNVITIPKPAP